MVRRPPLAQYASTITPLQWATLKILSGNRGRPMQPDYTHTAARLVPARVMFYKRAPPLVTRSQLLFMAANV
jgi:hypothetical protein